MLADSPEFFVARGNTRGDILLFAFAMVLVPPTLMIGVEALAARWPRVREALHLVFVGLLVAAFAAQLLDDALGTSSGLEIVLAIALGAGAAVAYARTRGPSTALTVLGPAPLLFLFLFLVTSPVSKLVLPQGSAEAASADIRSHTPVVMVVFDEFDPNMLQDLQGHIDRSRYPNFAALADHATFYRNATTVNSQTTLAVPAVLSGRRPTPDMLPITADYPNSIFTLLGESHDMDVTETATELCPTRLCGEREREPTGDRLRSLAKDLSVVSAHLVSPEGLESRLPKVDQTFGNFGGGGRDQARPRQQPDVPQSALLNRPAQVGNLVDGIHRGGRPALHLVHTALPHIPWQYLPDGKQYINAGPDYPGLDREVWSSDPFPARLGLQRHLLQVGYADRLLGHLLARLRETGQFDRSMIVITADHGVSYHPGKPRRAPTAATIGDIAAVPLLIKYPGEQHGRIDDSMVRTVDIVPTIADRLGAKLPWHADGRPIRPGRPASDVVVGIGATGRNVRVPFDRFVEQRKAGLARLVFLFGADDGGRRLYANGPNWDLLGKPETGLPEAASTGARVELDSVQQLDHYNPSSHVAPSFVSGRIVGGLRAGTSIAVAVNGKIASITQSFPVGPDLRLAAIVPPTAFRAGSNSLDVFAVEGAGRARGLAPLGAVRPKSYRLVEQDGKTVIEGGGQSVTVQKGALDGFVDSHGIDDQGARMSGWAVDPDGPKPVDRILLFDGERLVAQARPTVARPDIVDRYNAPALKLSGFELRGSTPGAEQSDLHVYAVHGDKATELQLWNG